MGVCTSQSRPKNQKKSQLQSLTTPPVQPPPQKEKKSTTVQFQEATTIMRASTPRKPSQVQGTTPAQRTSPNHATTPQRNQSINSASTPKLIQPSSSLLQEKQRNDSLLIVPGQRSSTRINSRSIQSPASRNYSIVQGRSNQRHGTTVMQHNDTGQMVVVELLKFENRNQQFLDQLEETKLDNMHIVKVIDTHTDYQKRNYQILYEHCQGGRLSKFLEQDKLDDQTLGAIFYQMIEALAYVHGLGMSHDELTIDSFSIFDDSATPFVKLTDIRSIYQFVYTKNSIYYEPPESIGHHQHNPHDKAHSEQLIQTKNRSQANDIWALGIIMLQLINKKLPFDPEIETIHHFHPDAHLKKQSEINQLLLEMLKKHPESRLSLSKCLLHPCLQKMKQVQAKDFLEPLRNMVKCKNMSYLHQTLFRYLLQIYASDHLKILVKLFTTADQNKDGSLSKQELLDLFKTEGKDLVDQLDLEDDLTLEDFQLMAADKELILNENVLESSFRTFSKSYNNISAKFICKTIVECDEEKIQSDFDTYNLNYSFCFKEYSEFLQNYQSPKAIQ